MVAGAVEGPGSVGRDPGGPLDDVGLRAVDVVGLHALPVLDEAQGVRLAELPRELVVGAVVLGAALCGELGAARVTSSATRA